MQINKWFVVFLICSPFLALFILKIPNLPEDQCRIITGCVEKITEAGTKDVCFKLEGERKIYYVNRGLENGLDLHQLRNELLNKVVTLKYPNHWTNIFEGNFAIHIAKVEYEGKIIYSEF